MTPIALYITACLAGTLHGEPHSACREFEFHHSFPTVEKCVDSQGAISSDWLDGLKTVMPDADIRITALRCAPATAEDEDP